MNVLKFYIRRGVSINRVWRTLQVKGLSLLYSEEGEQNVIYATETSDLNLAELPFKSLGISEIERALLPDIDWESQWKDHSPSYFEGYLQLDLSGYQEMEASSALRLHPGPGFGDLSHPTTRLVLQLMEKRVRGKRIFDIGTGSGILSLAAWGMGASQIVGVDIEEKAIQHAKKNSELNGNPSNVSFFFVEEFHFSETTSFFVLMNMIQSEQMIAWETWRQKKIKAEYLITSGILKEGREEYLHLCRKWKLSVVEEREEGGWLGFLLQP